MLNQPRRAIHSRAKRISRLTAHPADRNPLNTPPIGVTRDLTLGGRYELVHPAALRIVGITITMPTKTPLAGLLPLRRRQPRTPARTWTTHGPAPLVAPFCGRKCESQGTNA